MYTTRSRVHSITNESKRESAKRPLDNTAIKSSASINASSTVCGVVGAFDQLNLLNKSTTVDEFIDTLTETGVTPYDLNDLREHIKYKESLDGVMHEEGCRRLVQMLLKKRVTFVVNSEINLEGFKSMHSCIWSNKQKPDVALYVKNKLIVIIEVHSCSSLASFQNTIRKLILGLVDLIRFYSHFSNITSMEGLVCPKKDVKKWAIKVLVSFSKFVFIINLNLLQKRNLENISTKYTKIIYQD